MRKIIIEHLEEEFAPWILLEYRHCSLIAGKDMVLFTNVPKRYHRVLERYGRVKSESIIDLVSSGIIKGRDLIVLDPKASRRLERRDLLGRYVVIGGILGDHPPRGRTWRLLTRKLLDYGVITKNIGDGQYSIDGAVYYVVELWKNNLEGYKFIDGVDIETPNGIIHLPFRYPVVDNKPLLAPGLIEYLVHGRLPREVLEEIGLS